MKKEYIIGIIILVVIGVSIGYTFSGSSPQQDDYIEKVKKERTEKDETFRDETQSPIKNLEKFTGLNYYEPDIRYKVTAEIEKFGVPEPYPIKMSNGKQEDYLKFAKATFSLNGEDIELLLLKKSLQDPIAFTAFTDLTSGDETYGAGRYLDIPVPRGTLEIEIDFNKAYNPYCAYNADYICPKPPKENRLKIAVEAGEKSYEDF